MQVHNPRSNMPTISANDLVAEIKADLGAFDFKSTTTAITRFFEQRTQRRVTFAALVLAMLQSGFGVVPHGTTFRFLPMQTNA